MLGCSCRLRVPAFCFGRGAPVIRGSKEITFSTERLRLHEFVSEVQPQLPSGCWMIPQRTDKSSSVFLQSPQFTEPNCNTIERHDLKAGTVWNRHGQEIAYSTVGRTHERLACSIESSADIVVGLLLATVHQTGQPRYDPHCHAQM